MSFWSAPASTPARRRAWLTSRLAQRRSLSLLPAGNDLKTIVFSVNEKTLTAEDQVISAASCTTNCLAPMADTLNKTYPIVSGIMTTVHAYTGDR